ncbi:HesB/YadR/YfhF family protein [Sporosarcina pasteurii]|uniref:Iron-sulphur cluster biosynthesis n=1 Tax=Sporosarcina pasteurii TaxID=1474 RepID=A0A380BSM5_SPOPA|nr:HesB/YadR/YfhF family protein [Sporosarcina pasteurii]MDS9471163.1 HesB/YadR/YfhF family protein [Sporosarcina pasteurii]QBQ05198.1 hypothetical protein E2C16_05720 [Sporosarcina pasteurii]SUJ05359.1 Iron-sulphur cluster biosynthesis [Sporosarcina pasteurii]
MNIVLSDEALKWFRDEMEVSQGDAIRFFARYGGSSPLHEGFSLGVTKIEPDEASVQVDKEGVLYYIESRDEWFFDGHDLIVEVDPKLQELSYSYKKS